MLFVFLDVCAVLCRESDLSVITCIYIQTDVNITVIVRNIVQAEILTLRDPEIEIP